MGGYTDVDHAGDFDTHKSTFGCYFVGIVLHQLCSKQQLTAAKSSIEAEYITLSGAADECMWLCRLLMEIGFSSIQRQPLGNWFIKKPKVSWLHKAHWVSSE